MMKILFQGGKFFLVLDQIPHCEDTACTELRTAPLKRIEEWRYGSILNLATRLAEWSPRRAGLFTATERAPDTRRISDLSGN
jgi:hypothetical protein